MSRRFYAAADASRCKAITPCRHATPPPPFYYDDAADYYVFAVTLSSPFSDDTDSQPLMIFIIFAITPRLRRAYACLMLLP